MKTNVSELVKLADLQALNAAGSDAARSELVDLPFSLAWVLGRCLITLLGHGIKRLGTIDLYQRTDPLDSIQFVIKLKADTCISIID